METNQQSLTHTVGLLVHTKVADGSELITMTNQIEGVDRELTQFANNKLMLVMQHSRHGHIADVMDALKSYPNVLNVSVAFHSAEDEHALAMEIEYED